MSKRVWRWLLFSLVLAAPISTSQAAGPPPKLPACVSHVIKIDSSRLESLRREYETSKGQGSSEEDFMFTWLPARIFSRILFGDFNVKDLPSDFGLLYWSGFNGGVWLNETVHLTKGLGIDWSWMIRSLKSPMLRYLESKTESRLRLIASGSAGQKEKAARKAIKFLAMSYGYNRGYLLEILKHPPVGANTPENILVCGEFLECHYGSGDQTILAPFLPVRAKLANPPNAEWQTIASTVRRKLPGSIERGGWVWRRIMSGREFSVDSYMALLDISTGFLMLNETVMLAVCQAVAERNEPQLERALAADAASLIGLSGYVIGLGKKISAR
jgi:hypothetical protein